VLPALSSGLQELLLGPGMKEMLCCLPYALGLVIWGGGGEFCSLLRRTRLDGVSLPYPSNSASAAWVEAVTALQVAWKQSWG